MNNTWENFDLIEAWKNKELSPEEARKFEYEIMHNVEMAKEVDTYNRLIDHIETYGNRRTQNTIDKVVSKLEKEGFFNNELVDSNIKSTNLRKWKLREWLVAASFLLLVAVVTYVSIPKKSDLPDFAKLRIEEKELNYTIEKLGAAAFSNAEEGRNDSLSKALQLYKEFEYQKAKLSLLQIVNDYPDDQMAQLYLGLSYLQNSEYAKAAKYLSPLTRAEGFEYKNTAKWYAVWCFAKFNTEHDLATARALLKELAEDPLFEFSEYARAYLDLFEKRK